ncbi:MAG: hypothetical protein FWF22_07120, partial [Treponema sp.]|nr:hypothetical protein [Treponema sp.]
MEQKKLILVAISVGIFLVIAIGAAILVFGSSNTSPAMVSARAIPAGSPIFPATSSIYDSPVGGQNVPAAVDNTQGSAAAVQPTDLQSALSDQNGTA